MRGLVFAVVLSAFSFGVHAEGVNSIGLAMTNNKSIDVCSGEPVDTACENSSRGYRISLGHKVWEHASVEVGYEDFGDVESNFSGYYRIETVKLSGRALDVFLRGQIPINKSVRLIGKIGVASWKGEYSQVWDDPRFPDFHYVNSYSDSGRSLVASAGISVGWVEMAVTNFFDVSDEDLRQLSVGVNVPIGR